MKYMIFYIFMYNFNIVKMKVSGSKYIWFYGYVSSKIDRVICNYKWIIQYSINNTKRENGISDHLLIIIDIVII